MNFETSKIIIVFLIMLFFTACLKPVSYPDEPIIEYVGFEKLSDSGKITFSFTDGDGDIGLDQNMVNGEFAPGSFYHYNLYINYFEMMNGQWVRGTADPNGNNFLDSLQLDDTIFYPYRLENITPTGQNKALNGTIEITLEPRYFNPFSNHNDSIMYKILLIDRSLNHSNLLSTPLIVR